MKVNFIILTFILLSLTFDSCFEDDVETLPSCVSVDTVSTNDDSITPKIYETKELEFELFNDCDSNYTIYDYEISGDIKNIRIEGLSKNEIITSKKLPFKVIYTIATTGNKTIGFFIRTDIGQMAVSIGINPRY